MDLSSNKKDDMDYDSEDEEINISENDDSDSTQRPAKRARSETRGISSDSEKNEVNNMKKIMIKADLNRNNVQMESLDKYDSSETQDRKERRNSDVSLGSTKD